MGSTNGYAATTRLCSNGTSKTSACTPRRCARQSCNGANQRSRTSFSLSLPRSSGNFVRNPFCVRKVLGTFRTVTTHQFTDQALRDAHALVLEGSRAQEAEVCARYAITPGEYHLWLRTLFMLLSVTADEHNLFEHAIKAPIVEIESGGHRLPHDDVELRRCLLAIGSRVQRASCGTRRRCLCDNASVQHQLACIRQLHFLRSQGLRREEPPTA